jgi:glycosyltransferase involved in cell wall biosynthesis
VAPRITVVTVCRNALRALRRTTASVLGQAYPQLEYWIVDGASNDGTAELLAELAAQGVRVRSEPDRGISDAMNKGIGLATGDWIGHLHAGDEYLAGALERVARAIERFPEAEVLCGYMLKREPGGERMYQCAPERLRWDMTVNHPATWIHRRVFERHGGFDPEFRRAMDYEMFLRFRVAGVRFEVIPEPLARMEYGGLSESSLWKTLAETQRARRARLPSGFERSFAYLVLLCARGVFRRALESVGLGSLVAWYRRRHALVRKD